MTETVSNVFDIACPSPLKLQEISSLAIVAVLWRREIRSCLKGHRPLPIPMYQSLTWIVLEEALPNMPRRVYDLLYKYVNTVGYSISSWIRALNFDDCDEILRMFHDFALDWNGTIHEVRTAKRMMLCDRIGILEKFRIACLYCFEKDIKRIWPSVRTKINLSKFRFEFYQQLHYWTCYLRNELHKLPNQFCEPIDEMMLYECKSNNYSGALYFWNRIPLERQSRVFISVIKQCRPPIPQFLPRFLLPKLNESQLVKCLAAVGKDLITRQLIGKLPEDRDLVLPIWMYIRNKIDKGTFNALIWSLLIAETNSFNPQERLNYQSEVYLCCVIWNRANQSLKQSVFDNVLPESKCFSRQVLRTIPRETRFLMTVLSDASFEERSAFWTKHWRTLIESMSVEELLKVMKLCFRNEEEITLFKENTMFKYENIKLYFVYMLESEVSVEIVNSFLSFCNSDAQKGLELKQRFLHDPDNGVSNLLYRNEALADEFLNDTV